MEPGDKYIEKYGQMMISQQIAIFNLKYITDNLTKNEKYYENNEELLLRLLSRIQSNLERVLSEDA